ncbi:FAD/NAD(P)-binding protein [Ensifer sp. 4252]|uniref:FAD/NAD(P)-binding protein n=1 Tax=Ensifer sp. 4252 TaxID=3373915 RepID=UPI003D19D0B7
MLSSERNATERPEEASRGYDVAIVGAGFSAISLAMNLLRVLRPPVSVAIVGDDPGFGRGTAYRTDLRVHRLNVAAARMSVYADEPDDFLSWLGSRYGGVSPDGFAARTDYGLYLRDRLAAALRDRDRAFRIDFIKAKATSCNLQTPPSFGFELDNGETFRAANVVLALGVGSADIPAADQIDDQAEHRIVRNPWRLSWLSRVRAAETVLMLGSGLTMIDQVLALFARGHEGKVHVLSRRGLVSHSHATHKLAPVTPARPESREISALLASLRAQARETCAR